MPEVSGRRSRLFRGLRRASRSGETFRQQPHDNQTNASSIFMGFAGVIVLDNDNVAVEIDLMKNGAFERTLYAAQGAGCHGTSVAGYGTPVPVCHVTRADRDDTFSIRISQDASANNDNVNILASITRLTFSVLG